MKRVLISEDHTMFATMIKLWLEQSKEAQVVGLAQTGEQTLRLLKEHKPDVLLQDMMLGEESGLTLIGKIRKEYPNLTIFAISARANLAKLALEAGANGCMLKEDNPQVIKHALEWDLSTGVWVSPLLGERFFRASQELLKFNFTIAEVNILRNINHTNLDISEKLGISEGTVRNTLNAIYQKTGLTTRVELVRYSQDVLLLTHAHI